MLSYGIYTSLEPCFLLSNHWYNSRYFTISNVLLYPIIDIISIGSQNGSMDYIIYHIFYYPIIDIIHFGILFLAMPRNGEMISFLGDWRTSPYPIHVPNYHKLSHWSSWKFMPWTVTNALKTIIIKKHPFGYGSIPMDTFLVGWTSINPSYFDVNYRGTRFWHTAIWEGFESHPKTW